MINNLGLAATLPANFRFYLYDEQNTDPLGRVRIDDVEFFLNSACDVDTDMDGLPDRIDTDSDNDGCPDAIEGAGTFNSSDLIANDSLTNLPAQVDGNGVPTVAASGQGTTPNVRDDSAGSVACTADVQILKTASNLTPMVGDVITFDLVITNNGPDVALDIVIDDVVLSGFTFVAGSMTGGTTQNQVAPNLQWTIDSLASGAGNAITLQYQATVVIP